MHGLTNFTEKTEPALGTNPASSGGGLVSSSSLHNKQESVFRVSSASVEPSPASIKPPPSVDTNFSPMSNASNSMASMTHHNENPNTPQSTASVPNQVDLPSSFINHSANSFISNEIDSGLDLIHGEILFLKIKLCLLKFVN